VVYPAIAAAFVFLTARKHLRSTLWLFLPSFIYAFVTFTLRLCRLRPYRIVLGCEHFAELA